MRHRNGVPRTPVFSSASVVACYLVLGILEVLVKGMDFCLCCSPLYMQLDVYLKP